MICKKCNHKLPDDSEFCQYCGSKIENVEAVESDTIDDNATELIDELSNPDITPEDALNAISKFQAKATIDEMEANVGSQPDNEGDDDFGLVPEKPIFTLALKSVDGEEEYLNKLYTESGEKIKYARRGSTSAEGINGMIDIYDTFLPSGQPYKTIYINMYGAKASVSAPKGFKFASATTSTPVSKVTPKIKKVSKPKKPINKRLWITVSSIALAVVIILILLPTLIIPSAKYNHAKNLLENGDYELAYSAFLALDGFSDSENMLPECRYLQAIKYRDAGNHEDANKIFKTLGNYRDSKLLIHEHDYKLDECVMVTCTTPGTEVYKCTKCDDNYIVVIPANHSYTLSSSIDATCTSVGVKNYKCKNCTHTYSEEIGIKDHSYSEATCLLAKTCNYCNKTEGDALGHSNTVICTRCGHSNFETITLSGTTTFLYERLYLPVGEYDIIIDCPGTASCEIDIYNGIAQKEIFYKGSYTAGTYRVVKYTVASEIVDGFIYISTSGKWTITIKAVGN